MSLYIFLHTYLNFLSIYLVVYILLLLYMSKYYKYYEYIHIYWFDKQRAAICVLLFWNDDNKHLFNSISSAEKGETGREKKKNRKLNVRGTSSNLWRRSGGDKWRSRDKGSEAESATKRAQWTQRLKNRNAAHQTIPEKPFNTINSKNLSQLFLICRISGWKKALTRQTAHVMRLAEEAGLPPVQMDIWII